MPEYYIKVRKVGDKRFKFLARDGYLNSLRIHAVRFTKESAEKTIADNGPLNPDMEFKAVPFVKARS